MEFCEKLIRLRKTHHMTQDDLAQALRVSRQAVYKWECGQSYPEALKLVALKEIFGISIDNLLDPSFEVQMPPRTRKRRGTEVLEDMKAEQAQRAANATQDLPETAPAVAPKFDPEEENPRTEEVKAAPEVAEAPVPAPEAKEVKSEKRGFFSRLFGRK